MKDYRYIKMICGSIIVSVMIFASMDLFNNALAYLYRKQKHKDAISVTGSKEMEFASNFIAWEANFSKRNKDLKLAYASLKADRQLIKDFLLSNGVKESEIIFKSIDISKDYKNKSKYNKDGDKVDTEQLFIGYILNQNVEVQSNNVDLIEGVANKVTDLIEKDVRISSYAPSYYYTNLEELKIKMIDKASKDGLQRAQTAVEGAGGELGDLLHTSIGVFQILGKNSDENFSWGGTLNTTHKNKIAYVNVKQRYEIK